MLETANRGRIDRPNQWRRFSSLASGSARSTGDEFWLVDFERNKADQTTEYVSPTSTCDSPDRAAQPGQGQGQTAPFLASKISQGGLSGSICSQ